MSSEISGYGPRQYRDMLLDVGRTDAYSRAIERAVSPGASVVEIGTGVGFFAILACHLGAARVDAIEPNSAIAIAEEMARLDGCAERIRFHRGRSNEASIEPADVMISDLRGALPLFTDHLASLVDARERLLKPGGITIPTRDRVWLALMASETPPVVPGSLRNIDLAPLNRHAVHHHGAGRVRPEELASDPVLWHTVDYRTLDSPDAENTVELRATRGGWVRGLCAWFDTDLFEGIGFDAGPNGNAIVYGQCVFGIEPALRVEAGDVVEVTLRARSIRDRYVWIWRGRTRGSAGGATFEHSNLEGSALDPMRLRKRALDFRPRRGPDADALIWVLSKMEGAEPLGAIAREAASRFSEVFPDEQAALAYVADISERMGA